MSLSSANTIRYLDMISSIKLPSGDVYTYKENQQVSPKPTWRHVLDRNINPFINYYILKK